jgi:putative tryptophan/tyrosine transport system substrate-binding protein
MQQLLQRGVWYSESTLIASAQIGGGRMRRREFVRFVGGVSLAWPLAAYPQSATMPVIGFLDPRSPDAIPKLLRAFLEGLKETGDAEGENVAVEYRWAEDQIDQLPGLVADLVQR